MADVTTSEQIQEYIDAQTPVFIEKTNERGFEEYAVCVASLPDFWLGAFPTLSKAQEFCAVLLVVGKP